MIRKASTFIALLCALSLATGADAAQRARPQKAEPPPPPPQFKVDGPTRTMSIERFGNAVPVGSVIGKFTQGCFSARILNGEEIPLYSDNAFRNVPQQDFMNEFITEAVAAGYKLSGQQTGDLFGSQGDKAELIVGANILDIKETACIDMTLGILSGTQADATMTVDWQVFDPLSKKLVFRATSQGVGRAYIKGQQTMTIPIDGARAAFRNAAKNIVANPDFLAALRDPKGGPASSSDLFSQTTAAPLLLTLQIARLPLSTNDFSTRIDDLRKQVVTVRTPQGTGSAYYISDTLLLTNDHVVTGFKQVLVRFLDGREFPADVIASDVPRDVALLRTQNAGVVGIPLQLEKPPISSRVFVVGSPGTRLTNEPLEGTVTAGIVSAFRNVENLGPFIQSDVAVTHGNSGGPMFDDRGNVIGMTDLGLPDSTGQNANLNLFIPIGDALRALKVDFAPAASASK